MAIQNIEIDIPREDILNTMSSGFFNTVEDFFEVSIDSHGEDIVETETFAPSGHAIGQIDFVGSVAGFVAVSADKKFLEHAFDVDASSSTLLNDLATPLKEILNTVAGKCLKILLKEHSIVTMLAPKVTFGDVFYPKVKCYCKTVKTPHGDISFHLSVDQMKLDISRLADKLTETEKNSQKVMEYLQMLFGSLEKAQTHIMNEVSLTVSNIKVIEDILSKGEGSSTEITSDIAEALNSVSVVKDLVVRKLSDTIYDLKRFKNLLLNHMLINRQHVNDERLEVMLAGTLTERCDLSFFGELKKGVLEINTKNLLNYSAKGAGVWVNAIKAVPNTVEVRFVSCSPEFMAAGTKYDGFLKPSQVASIAINHVCDQCHHRRVTDIKVDLNPGISNSLPSVLCVCGLEMNPLDDQQGVLQYFDVGKSA